MQLMADTLGGTVAPAPQREFGHAMVKVTGNGQSAALFADVPNEIRVWASHGDRAGVNRSSRTPASAASSPLAGN